MLQVNPGEFYTSFQRLDSGHHESAVGLSPLVMCCLSDFSNAFISLVCELFDIYDVCHRMVVGCRNVVVTSR